MRAEHTEVNKENLECLELREGEVETDERKSDLREHRYYKRKVSLYLSWRNIHGEILMGRNGLNQFSSVTQLCPTLCDPMDCSTPGFPVHHQLPELTQTHAHWVGDAIQPSHPLFSPSPPTLNLSQHQGLFKWVSSHQVAKVLELQLLPQSFQWILRIDFL